jgi:hypothetical protein
MEASMAAQGQGDAGDGYGEGQSNGFDGVGMDPAALADQFGQLTEGQEEMRSILAGLQEHLTQPQEDGPGLPPLDLDASDLEHAGGDPGDAFGDPMADAHEQAQALEAFVTDRVQQAVAPLAQEMEQRWRAGEYRDLAHELPELGHEGVLGEVLNLARTVADAEGWPAQMASSPAMIRMTYLATRAVEAAQHEPDGEEPPTAAHLEGGGGAGPCGGRGASAAQAIVGAGRTNPLPFG